MSCEDPVRREVVDALKVLMLTSPDIGIYLNDGWTEIGLKTGRNGQWLMLDVEEVEVATAIDELEGAA